MAQPEPKNYGEILPFIVPTVLKGEAGSALVGALSTLADKNTEDWRHALRASWIGDSYVAGPGPAYDALTPAGKELGLPRYPPEPWDQYHARLHRVWQDMAFAGDELTLIAQLEATGFPGAQIYTPHDWPDEPGPAGVHPYWSQFWIVFTNAASLGLSVAPDFGDFDYGDGSTYGITGMTPLTVKTLRGIIRQFKPAHWICRSVIFVFGDWFIGDPRTLSVLTAGGALIGDTSESATIGV